MPPWNWSSTPSGHRRAAPLLCQHCFSFVAGRPGSRRVGASRHHHKRATHLPISTLVFVNTSVTRGAVPSMAIKTRRITCKMCGQRETVLRGERGSVSAYCDACRTERKREQARLRMQAMRARHALPPGSTCAPGLTTAPRRAETGDRACGAALRWVVACRSRNVRGSRRPRPAIMLSTHAMWLGVVGSP